MKPSNWIPPLTVALVLCVAWPQIACGQERYPVFGDAVNAEEIEQALETTVSIAYQDTSLEDVVRDLRRRLGINISIDRAGLDEVGLGVDTPLSATFDRVTLESALHQLILDPLELALRSRGDVLVITTPEKAHFDLLTRVYPVRDLILVRDSDDNTVYGDYDSLINVITAALEPESWDSVGGPGAIEPFPNAEGLVISQTYQIHRKIENLLTALRAARKHQGIIPLAAEPASSATRAAYRPRQKSWRPAPSPSQPSRRIVYEGSAGWRLPRVHQ